MDRTNLGHQYHGSRRFVDGKSDARFDSPVSPFPSVDLPPALAGAKQSAATGLSRPRMAKARKQLSSSRARPAVVADTKDGSGFSTFRYPAAVTVSGAPESDGAQGLRERFVGWNPFESSKLDNLEHFKNGMGTGAFVFQSGMEASSSISQSIGEDLSKLGRGDCDSQPTVSNLGPESIVVDHDRNRCVAADGMFTFGNGLKENVSSGQNSPFIGPNLDDFVSSKSESPRFVYGAGSSLNFRRDYTDTQNKPSNLDPFGSVAGGKKSFKPHLTSSERSKLSDLDFSDFHIGTSRSAAFVPELVNNLKRDDPDKLSDETSSVVDKTHTDSHSSDLRKNDTMSSRKSQNPGVPVVNTSVPTKLESTFIFGASSTSNSDSNSSVPRNHMRSLGNMTDCKSGIYDELPSLFSNRVPISSNSIASNIPSFCSLHDEMEKLNLQNYGDPVASHRSNQTEEKVKHNIANSFIFGNNKSASISLCDNMEKLNLQYSGDHITSQMKNQADDCEKLNSANFFLFGNNKGAPSSSGGGPVNALAEKIDTVTIQSPVNVLSEKINKVSIRSMQASQSSEAPFNFMSTREQVGMPHMEFRSSRTTDDMLKENLFSGSHKSAPFSGKKAESKASRMRKRNGKLNNFSPQHQTFAQTFPFAEEAFESKYTDSANCYSPMDYTPYQENLVVDASSREDSSPLYEFDHVAESGTPINTEQSVHIDESENLISATQCLNITEDNLPHREPGHINARDQIDKDFDPNTSASFVSEPEIIDFSCEHSFNSMEKENELLSEGCIAEASNCGACFTFTSSVESSRGSDFTFGSSSFTQVPLSTSKHQHRRKNRMEVVPGVSDSSSSSSLLGSMVNTIPIPSKSMQSNNTREPKNVGNTGDKTNTNLESKKDLENSHSQRVAEQEACERWRLRGNQAYANGHLLKAEEYYTQGLNSMSHKEHYGSCNRELMLCYSNRAAARMSLGRMREALDDCMQAVAIDSHFLRAQVRIANCYLALGEIDRAMIHFKECLSSMPKGSPDAKILTEASDGLEKAQHVADHVGQAEELLHKKTFDEVTKALQLISESLLISTHSERLMEWKAEALLMIRRYEEVIKFCEQTMEHAEYNVLTSGTNGQSSKVEKHENLQDFPLGLWRWHLMAKANFFLGRLDEAFELLKKHNQRKSITDKNSNEPDSSTQLFATIHDLLRLKAAGNEAFKEGRHLDAIKHYSAALALNIESRPFTAICLSNRAASYQSLGQITDAIADCSLAIALDPTYPKALSRRASLYEMIRDYEQASNDLCRLVSLLERQIKVKDNQNVGAENSDSNLSDLRHARLRLSIAEEAARKDIPLDMHVILGIEPSSSAADIKKAYRKAALRHHPDKAGQILVRSETSDGAWREVAEEVHRDADRLFKLIGEAYTVLSDATRYKFTKI
ncbi:uncharacterized protein LOC141841714 isoform X1 [Curcuma longa]|uniref:uncharacterized protein LOC141841714 isoform X1 n=1 Tax=Curcuma longa TaxID=136217 RepID=UPI003D9E50CE